MCLRKRTQCQGSYLLLIACLKPFLHKYKQPALKWGFGFTNPSEILSHSSQWGEGVYKLCVLTLELSLKARFSGDLADEGESSQLPAHVPKGSEVQVRAAHPCPCCSATRGRSKLPNAPRRLLRFGWERGPPADSPQHSSTPAPPLRVTPVPAHTQHQA